MSAVIYLDSSDEDNDVVEVMETTSEGVPQAGPKKCLNPMRYMTSSHGFVMELIEVINFCFKLESSERMERVFTKNLIPKYKELDNDYVKSDKLKCFLKKTLQKLKKEPDMKFSCLNEISENFKANKIKKRVNIVTLNTKASDKFKRYYKMQNKKTNKNKPENIIILDENDDPHPQVINLDDEPNDVIDLESCDNANSVEKDIHVDHNYVNCDKSSQSDTKTMEHPIKDTNHTVQNENVAHTNNVEDSDSEGTISHTNSSDWEIMEQADDDNIEIDRNKNSNENTAQNINTDSEDIVEIRHDTFNTIPATNYNYKSPLDSFVSNKNDLLNVSLERNTAESRKITELESEIKYLKQTLQQLEEREVIIDNFSSPYFEAHKIKLLIIDKFKRICKLRGENYKPNKSRQFQLKVKEGHPAGPARKLEEWLNTNTDKNGEPLFPNLRDVIKCVWVANQEDDLGWDINRSYQEARILFTQCGKHLQQRRKQREWRDLLQTAKAPVDQDPADSDPELQKKLEANRLLARDKYNGIIEHYVKLEEDSRKTKKCIKITDIKSLSNTNDQNPCWEVPISGLITITPLEPIINHEPNKDIKQENIDESVNNTEETSNHVVVLNERSKNNVFDEAYNLCNSVLKDNNNTIQIDRQTKSDKSSENSQELNDTANTKTIESNSASDDINSSGLHNSKSNSHVNSTLEYNSKLRRPETLEITFESGIQTELAVALDKHKENDKLLTNVERNHNITCDNQTDSYKGDCAENMETEDLISLSENLNGVEKKVDSQETMDTDQDIENVNNDIASNTAQIIDKTISADDNKDRTNNITITPPNDSRKIKSEVKMEIDFSEEDFDLMLDKNFSCDITASASVFDVEDLVVFIEITSSDSESDDDDCQLITL